MSPPRLPRFRREKNIPPLEVTARDTMILKAIHSHRFLRSWHVTALIGGSGQQILRRLQLLYHHGFLERPRAQLEYYHRGGSKHFVYGLGSKGAHHLAQATGLSTDTVDWGEKNRSVGRIYLEHALLVSDVTVALKIDCKKSGVVFLTPDSLLPLPRTNTQASFRWRVEIMPEVSLGVIPDSVFALETARARTGPERAYFFLEADRGTMPVMRENLQQTSMYRKFLTYEATWAQSIHRARFAFHRFRMLTVTQGPARMDSLLAACSKLERGQGLFLFTDAESLTKSGPLAAIWKSPRNNVPVRLVD